MVSVGIRVGVCALGLGCALLTGEAVACGGGGLTTAADGVVADAQRVFMAVNGERTDVIVQIGVPATTADYGVLIPVPGEPTLDVTPFDSSDFYWLDEETAPSIVAVDDSESSNSGCGCGTSNALGDGSTKGGARGGGVSVTEPVNIGPVSAVVLTGTDGDAVNDWLSDNGFSIPEAEQSTVAAYSGPDRYFIALRRSETAAPGGPTSVGIGYSLAGDHRMMSLGFARIGAAPSVAFTLFLATSEAVGAAAPFTTLSLDDLDAGLLRRGDYRGALERAVAARDSRAFVIESAHPKEALTQLTPRISNRIPIGGTLTRLSTVIAAEALADDAMFTAPYTRSVPGERYVSLTVPRAYAGVGTALALVLLGGLRRRSRRTS